MQSIVLVLNLKFNDKNYFRVGLSEFLIVLPYLMSVFTAYMEPWYLHQFLYDYYYVYETYLRGVSFRVGQDD